MESAPDPTRGWIRRALDAVPQLRYVLAVAAVAALATLARLSGGGSIATISIAVVVMLSLATIVVLFSHFVDKKKSKGISIDLQIKVLIWFFLVLIIVYSVLVTTSLWFGLPLDLRPVSGIAPNHASRTGSPVPLSSSSKADIRFLVGRPENPVFWLFNYSTELANRPRWQFLLYILDVHDKADGRANLRIPTDSSNDYISAGSFQGPIPFDAITPRKSLMVPGRTMFGIVTVDCANCLGRSSWVCVKLGQEGWVQEVPYFLEPLMWKALATIVWSDDPIAAIDRYVTKARRIPMVSELPGSIPMTSGLEQSNDPGSDAGKDPWER